MKQTMVPALVLGAHTVGLGVIRALGSMGVPVIAARYDERDMGHVSRYVAESMRVPHPADREDDFIASLLECAPRLEGAFLLPSTDAALVAVSRHKRELERRYVVGCTDWDVTELFIDKKRTYARAQEVGVPAPRTAVPRCIEDVERYALTARYPCLVKPSEGHRYFDRFRKKMVKADDLDQLLAAYREATGAGFEVMLQEFIPGDPSQGANYNSYSCAGETLVEFTAAKIRNAPRDTGSPCCNVSARIPEVLGPGRRILQAMGFSGYACTEFKKDPRDGVYKLMEVNGRHNLSSLLAVRCGINFPWIHYRHLVYDELPSACDYQTGIYWIDILRDLSVSPGYLFEERCSLARYLRPYLGPHVFAVPDRADPRPFRDQCGRLAKTAFRRPHAS